QRIAALYRSVQNCAMECGAIVIALPGQPYKLLHVLRRFIRDEFKSECAEACGYNGFKVVWRLSPDPDGSKAGCDKQNRDTKHSQHCNTHRNPHCCVTRRAVTGLLISCTGA